MLEVALAYAAVTAVLARVGTDHPADLCYGRHEISGYHWPKRFKILHDIIIVQFLEEQTIDLICCPD